LDLIRKEIPALFRRVWECDGRYYVTPIAVMYGRDGEVARVRSNVIGPFSTRQDGVEWCEQWTNSLNDVCDTFDLPRSDEVPDDVRRAISEEVTKDWGARVPKHMYHSGGHP
jgi:hypothetical protein